MSAIALRRTTAICALFAATVMVAPAAGAKTFKWANSLDTTSMDPYSRNVTFNFSFLSNGYEGLTRRTKDLKLEASLATEWKAIDPTTWRYTLRRGVKFHDGSPFSADDVVFSYKRATGPGTNMMGYFATVADVVKVDDYTVDIKTKAPDPILPNQLNYWFIMSKAWAERNGVTRIADLSKNEENFAVLNANGTGPFIVKSRTPDVETKWEANKGWWDKPTHNLTEVTFQRLQAANTRVAALLSGSVDMIYDVPTQNVDQLTKTKGLKVVQVPEARTMYLDLDQAKDELVGSNVKGKNPFKDIRVRRAVWHAIDTEAIKAKIMRGLAVPNALLVGPGLDGFDPKLNVRPKHDTAEAKKLLAEAGYPSGFEFNMECPNDRWVNDGQICQAVVGMLAQVGIKVNLTNMPFSQYVAKISPPNYGVASLALVGWAPNTLDAHNAIFNLAMSRRNGAGAFNVHNNPAPPEVDALGVAIAAELDPAKRTKLMQDALTIIRDQVVKIPIHQQVVLWAHKDSVSLYQSMENFFQFRHVSVK
jgi:peptide/nickel transport system substrate-binding protein